MRIVCFFVAAGLALVPARAGDTEDVFCGAHPVNCDHHFNPHHPDVSQVPEPRAIDLAAAGIAAVGLSMAMRRRKG